ncbi:acetyl-CoA carboxylase biotin carboxyl carrier protein [Ornithinibacillus sp. L9]|uniref:Biotin carboxyl carrier protein of acetyl-CoA carboxylase n=1 Tax=Ornithinibacillus caprae TaxID=2678566 RepID=A0A6N8FEP7_9BACI|nr:acetyl-CoA carboxylase biotin carboxyl carrier protein [Ornithinibacillus caprae]MUK87166.1 acetyl-CoA carboxylase biotin carboxyl carrier protein [Ornithinibacillus caprae]
MLKVQEIRELIKLIDQSTINEFTYETNGTTVSMKKSTETNTVQVTPVNPVEEVKQVQQPVQTQEAPAPTTPEVKPESNEEPTQKSVDYDYEITSPMVGTLYRAQNPESDPFVNVGSNVTKDSVVCIVEAMKLFNEIEAEVSGEIVEVLVENGELVEYGQPLFRVKTK